MAEFFRTSTIWIVDFRYKGSPRRWYKAFPAAADVGASIDTELSELYGRDARLVDLRRATEAEELQYLRGEVPVDSFCPTGR